MQKKVDNRKKNLIYSAILIVVFVSIWTYRRSAGPERLVGEKIEFVGQTMGTSYSIKYIDEEGRNYQSQIDSLLEVFNQGLSTYIPESDISRFNREAFFKFQSPFFYPVLKRSKEIYEITDGAFDPTIGPLVNAWGFGPEGRISPDSATVDSLRQLVNFDSIYFDTLAVSKRMEGMKLDFSAIAKGYGVDVVADYLRAKGIENIFVEIGGEIFCLGTNEQGRPWRVGVNYPSYDPQEQQMIQAIIPIHNRAIATSGNYRNFYQEGEIKYSHTISPQTGYPVQHTLLSASVFAPDCMTADAYATAFMVLGQEQAIRIDQEIDEIEIYLIYSDTSGQMQTFASPGVADKITIAER